MKFLRVEAPVFIRRSDAERTAVAYVATITYGRIHPATGPAPFNQKIEIPARDLRLFAEKLIAAADALDKVAVTGMPV